MKISSNIKYKKITIDFFIRNIYEKIKKYETVKYLSSLKCLKFEILITILNISDFKFIRIYFIKLRVLTFEAIIIM